MAGFQKFLSFEQKVNKYVQVDDINLFHIITVKLSCAEVKHESTFLLY